MAGGIAGYLQYAVLIVTSLHIWLGGMLGLVLSFVKSPRTFFYRKDRSQMEFKDCAPGLTHEYHIVNGVRLHVVVAGRPKEGQPRKQLMLFVHGFPEGHFSWRHQLAEFQQAYEVAALDLRGYGKSAKPKAKAAYRIFEVVQDLKELIEALGHEKCVLVAHDWGAVAAWRFAAYHQDMVERLIVMSAPPGELWMKNQDADQKRRSAYVWLFQAPLLPELLIKAHDLKAVEDAFTDRKQMGVRNPGAVSAEDIEHYKAQFAEPYAMTAALNYYRGMVDAATWNPPPRRSTKPAKPLTVPTLVLYGDSDAALGPQLWKGLDTIVTGAKGAREVSGAAVRGGFWLLGCTQDTIGCSRTPAEVSHFARGFTAWRQEMSAGVSAGAHGQAVAGTMQQATGQQARGFPGQEMRIGRLFAAL